MTIVKSVGGYFTADYKGLHARGYTPTEAIINLLTYYELM